MIGSTKEKDLTWNLKQQEQTKNVCTRYIETRNVTRLRIEKNGICLGTGNVKLATRKKSWK